MKELELQKLRAATSMNTALLQALFTHHPQSSEVLKSFAAFAEISTASLLASGASDQDVAWHSDALRVWMETLGGDTRN